jgi:hypothetical protein
MQTMLKLTKVDWTKVKYDGDIRQSFQFAKWLKQHVIKAKLWYTMDLTRRQYRPNASLMAKEEYLKESVRCDEIYQRQLVIFTQDQRNYVAVTEENLNRWAEYDEALREWGRKDAHNQSIGAGNGPHNGYPNAVLWNAQPQAPVPIQAYEPVRPRFQMGQQPFDRTHDTIIKDFDHFIVDCLLTKELILDTLGAHLRTDMETKMRVHQDVADQLQLLWTELHDFHQNTLPITAVIKAELTIMESATTLPVIN